MQHPHGEIVQNLKPNVEVLWFFNNSVGDFNVSSFHRFHNLIQLILRNVSLELSDFSAFYAIEKLKTLDISINNLANMIIPPSPGIFEYLRELKARNWQIQNISQILNWFNSSLRSLDLSGNDLRRVDPGVFKSLNLWHLLGHLYLDNTNLTKFDLNEYPSRVDIISIANNNLKQVNLSNLSKRFWLLNLEGNQLTELNVSGLSLHELRIAHNQFTCDYWANFVNSFCNKNILKGEHWMQRGEDCRAAKPIPGV